MDLFPPYCLVLPVLLSVVRAVEIIMDHDCLIVCHVLDLMAGLRLDVARQHGGARVRFGPSCWLASVLVFISLRS